MYKSRRKFYMFKCPRCNNEYPSYNSLSKHTRTAYKLKGDSLYREYHGITEIPLCKCGCGTETKWRSDRGYAEYATGHNSKGENNIMFGNHHTEEAKHNISQKRKEKFARGEYRIWQNEDTEETRELKRRIGEASRKENNPERARKISLALTGVPKSEEHKKNSRIAIKKAWENESLRDRQRIHIMNRFLDKKYNEPSGLELKFQKLLDDINIKYEFQFQLQNRLYDFHIPDTKILIETDGNFYHVNPSMFTHPKYKTQRDVIKNDIQKNELAEKEGYTLLRFWESDINERPAWVVQELLTIINSR